MTTGTIAATCGLLLGTVFGQVGPIPPSVVEQATGQTVQLSHTEATVWAGDVEMKLLHGQSVKLRPGDGQLSIEINTTGVELNTTIEATILVVVCETDQSCTRVTAIVDDEGFTTLMADEPSTGECTATVGCGEGGLSCTVTGPNNVCTCGHNAKAGSDWSRCENDTVIINCVKKGSSGKCVSTSKDNNGGIGIDPQATELSAVMHRVEDTTP